MLYAKIKDGSIEQYPSYPNVDHPNVSFPENWAGGVINGDEYVVVNGSEFPSVNIGWTVVEGQPVNIDGSWFTTYTTTLLSNEELKRIVTNIRMRKENNGVKVGDYVYDTSRESQTKYIAVALDILRANSPSWSIDWKLPDGTFVTLNALQMNEVIDAVKNHVQNCFQKEKYYFDLIDTSDVSVLESTDFSADWPSNS